MMSRIVSTVLLLTVAALLATLVIVLETAPPPSIKAIEPAHAVHAASQEG